MALDDPTFPPLLTGKPVRAPKRPFSSACMDALKGDAQAGDIYWAQNNRALDCAIVLEPEVSLSEAMQIPYVAMVAFGDAFGALAEPEVGLYYNWPKTFEVNGGEVGTLRIAAPAGTKPDQVPDWLILHIYIEVMGDGDTREPGENPDRTTLYEEGCGELTCVSLTESFSRHFLTWVHHWEEDGFRPIHDAWIGRAYGYDNDVEFNHGDKTYQGRVLGVDEAGQLLIKQGDQVQALDLKEIIEWQG